MHRLQQQDLNEGKADKAAGTVRDAVGGAEDAGGRGAGAGGGGDREAVRARRPGAADPGAPGGGDARERQGSRRLACRFERSARHPRSGASVRLGGTRQDHLSASPSVNRSVRFPLRPRAYGDCRLARRTILCWTLGALSRPDACSNASATGSWRGRGRARRAPCRARGRPRPRPLHPSSPRGEEAGRHASRLLTAVRHLPGRATRLPQPRSHSFSLDQRRRVCWPRTAMAKALRCPTSTMSRLPRVTPV